MQRTTILSWGFVVGLWGCNPSTVQGTRGAGDGAALGGDGAVLDGGGVDGGFGGDAVSGPDVPDGVVFLIHPEGAVPPRVETSARPLRPLSMSLLTTQRPGLHWILPPGAVGVQFQRCQDYRCSTVVETRQVTGTTFRYEAPLPVGTWFWRVRAEDDAGQAVGDWSAAWQFRTPLRDTPTDGVVRQYIDLNGDGYGDVVFTSASRLYAMLGGNAGLEEISEIITAHADGRDECRFVDTIDVNGDGLSDTICKSLRTNRYSVYLGRETGLPMRSYSFNFGATGELAANEDWRPLGDINGDGYQDALIQQARSDNVGQWLSVFLGDQSGLRRSPRFTYGPRPPQGELTFYQAAQLLSVVDADGDGYADLIFHFLEIGENGRSRRVMACNLWGSPGLPAISSESFVHDRDLLTTTNFISCRDRDVMLPSFYSVPGDPARQTFAVRYSGSRVPEFVRTPAPPFDSCIPDINNDGIEEAHSRSVSNSVLLSANGVLSREGATLRLPHTGRIVSRGCVGDFDRDGRVEYLYFTEDNQALFANEVHFELSGFVLRRRLVAPGWSPRLTIAVAH